MELKDKVIAVTGAAQGLGQAITQGLIHQGVRVVLIDRNEEALANTARELTKSGGLVSYQVADVTNEKQVESVFANIANDYQQLNGLVNSAGIMRDGMLLKVKDGKVVDKMSKQQFQSVLDVNVTGTFLCAREAAAQMIATQSQGVLINISSVSRSGNMGQSNYSASKSAVSTMTVTWAKELARFGIRTGCIAPGLVETDMARQMRPEMLERFLATVPLRRLADPKEMGHCIQFMFENDYFTGRTIELDGGTRV
jgi:3-oxoacyl-[acyl-carrier protein] reductase